MAHLHCTAGASETTLLSEWIHGGDGSQISPPGVAWLALDEEHSDPARFLLYLVSALQRARPDVGKATLDVVASFAGWMTGCQIDRALARVTP